MLEISLPRDWTLSFPPPDGVAEPVAELRFLGTVMCRLPLARSVPDEPDRRLPLFDQAEQWIDDHELSRLRCVACACTGHHMR